MSRKSASAGMKSEFRREFIKTLEGITDRTYRRHTEVFGSFCLMAACALSNQAREPEYLAEAGRWKAEDMRSFSQALGALTLAMEEEPYRDVLGPLHMEWMSSSGAKHLGEFYTPYDLCLVMAKMQFSPEIMPAGRPLDVSEPACGSASMILALANVMATEHKISPLCMRATCIDVNRTACDMAFINLTLWGIPATIHHGNALSLEQWGAWRNPFWMMARSYRAADPAESAVEPQTLVLQPTGQFAFDLEAA